MKNSSRIETDSMGEMRVPANAYYGAQTARALENFSISGLRFSRQFICALGLIKKHAAATNAALSLLPKNIADAIQQAAQEVVEGNLDEQFVVDILQTGSGTSTNMIFPILLIIVLVQTTVSVWAEPQDVKVTAVKKGSTRISGQKIEYPKTDRQK